MLSFTEGKKSPAFVLATLAGLRRESVNQDMDNIQPNPPKVNKVASANQAEAAFYLAESYCERISRWADEKAARQKYPKEQERRAHLAVERGIKDPLAAEHFAALVARRQGSGVMASPVPKRGAARQVFDGDSCAPFWLKEDPAPPRPRRSSRSSYAAKYRELIAQLTVGAVTNKALLRALRIWVKDGALLLLSRDGRTIAFEGWRKGGRRYQMSQMWTLKDRCALMQKCHKHCFFITLTQDPLYREKSLLSDYDNFSERVSKFVKEIQRHYLGMYAEVKESHVDGHTHAHVAFFSDYPFNPKTWRYLRTENGKYIVGGDIWNAVCQYWDWGFFNISFSEGKDAGNYLAKYMTKGHDLELEKIAKAENLSKARRKYLLGHFLPVLSGRRCFSSTSEKRIKVKALATLGAGYFLGAGEKLRKNRLINEISEGLLAALANGKAAEAAAAGREAAAPLARHGRAGLLERASTNFPCKRACDLRVLTQRQVSKLTRVPFPSVPTKSEPYLAALAKKGAPIGCSGCVFSHFASECRTLSDPWFHSDPQKLCGRERKLLRELIADRRFPNVGYNPFQLDFRVLAWVAPWSKLAQYVARRAAEEREQYRNLQMQKNRVDPWEYSSHGKIHREKVEFFDWERERAARRAKFEPNLAIKAHMDFLADTGAEKRKFLAWLEERKGFIPWNEYRYFAVGSAAYGGTADGLPPTAAPSEV